MRDFFEGIGSFFEDFAFGPMNWLRDIQYDSWWLANIFNWIFILIAAAALVYWLKELKKYNELDDENKEPTAHSFLE